MDRYGNKYFENLEEELPRKMIWTRQVYACAEYLNSEDTMGRLQEPGFRTVSDRNRQLRDNDADADQSRSQIEPGW
jgi:hypothetical protein